MNEFEARVTLQRHLINGGCSPDEANDHIHRFETATVNERVDEMAKKIDEIHAFMTGIANALNSPMVKAMLPPNMRGMLGG